MFLPYLNPKYYFIYKNEVFLVIIPYYLKDNFNYFVFLRMSFKKKYMNELKIMNGADNETHTYITIIKINIFPNHKSFHLW